MSTSDFGPLARTTRGSSSQVSVLDPSMFYKSGKLIAKNANGETAGVASYTMLHPSGGIAYLHLLLDASGSTWKRVKTGDKRRVYQYLLENFEQLVEGGNTVLQPNDVIYVWTFNRKTTLLCQVERKNFHTRLERIRAAYENEFDNNNHQKTRLYDAIATVMTKIREDYGTHENSDFFLVPFTDGIDHGSERITLNDMMNNINKFGGRLHTIFLTANMPLASDLYRRLESQQNEITHISCETTEPREISKAFNALRALIKSYLVIYQVNATGDIQETRFAEYGATKHDVAVKIMDSLYNSGSDRLLDTFRELSLSNR